MSYRGGFRILATGCLVPPPSAGNIITQPDRPPGSGRQCLPHPSENTQVARRVVTAVPEPSFAERARTLMHSGRIGSLSTLSRKQPGFPFGSLMPYALDGQGRPIFLISTMAMHTQNLQADPRASLFVTEPDASGDPLGASRVTLIGTC